MPKVPSNVVQFDRAPVVQPSMTELMMAAAIMDDHGKLFEADPFDDRSSQERLIEDGAMEFAIKNKLEDDTVFEHGGETWVYGRGALDRASEGQVIERSNKAMKERR